MRGQIQTGLCLREITDGGHLLMHRLRALVQLLRVRLDFQLEVHGPLLLLGLSLFGLVDQLLGVVVARRPRGPRVGGGVEGGPHCGLGAARHRGRGRVVLVVELLGGGLKIELSGFGQVVAFKY